MHRFLNRWGGEIGIALTLVVLLLLVIGAISLPPYDGPHF